MPRGRGRTDRQPKASINPAPGPLVPKALSNYLGDDGSHKHPVFSLSLVDRAYDGDWGWKLTDADSHRLLRLLCDMAAISWNAVRAQTAGGHKRHHYQPVTSLCSPARRRLRELELQDFDDRMFRFRDGATGRLWGFERDGIFYVVWWDPNHRVYPTEAA